VVRADVLDDVEQKLASDSDESRGELDEAFARFERTQPQLADKVSQVLSRPLDETALALGYFLSIAIWLSFERSFKNRLREVSDDEINATESALALEEELRAANGHEPLDLDDVVAIEQPSVMSFVNDHLDAALDVTNKEDGTEAREVDVDDVHTVYRVILALTLSLSHAVLPVEAVSPRQSAEILA
jgi:hypothetical protein